MPSFRPNLDEHEILLKAVTKFAHDPYKTELLSRLSREEAEYRPGTEEWTHLKFCVEQHHLHLQNEVRRDPKKKALKLSLDKAETLAKKFNPNFS